jgi:vanillate O-demethylase monooxygenase subunit
MSQIPDLFWHDSPQWVAVTDRFHVKANYQNLIDIQLDQTHSRYVHPTSLGNDGALATAPKVQRNARTVECARLMPDADPPPIWAKIGNFKGNVDHWIKWIYWPPSAVTFDVGVAEVGTGAFDGDMAHGINIRNSHGCTPETATTTHHFWVSARNFARDDAAIHAALGAIRNTFLEDVAMVEATERRIADDPAAPTIDVNADNPTIQARRLLARLIEESGLRAAG